MTRSKTSRRRNNARILATAMLAAAGVLLAQPAHANTWTWNGLSTTSDDWTDIDNWDLITLPVNDGTADIIFGGPLRTSPNLTLPYDINSLYFNTTAPQYTLVGTSGLTIGAGGIFNYATNTPQTVGVPITLSSSQTWHVANLASRTQFNELLTNSGTITKTGAGVVRISGQQSHSSGAKLDINEGAVVLDTDAGSNANRNLELTVKAGATLTNFSNYQHLKSLTIEDSAHAGLFTNGKRILVTDALNFDGSGGNWKGQLDLVDNHLAVRNGNEATIFNQTLQSSIDGQGIAWDNEPATALGVVQNVNFFSTSNPPPNLNPNTLPSGFTPIKPSGTVAPNSQIYVDFPVMGTYEPVNNTDVMVRKTWLGDANLDGVVDGEDFYLFGYGFEHTASGRGWYLGDFDGSGVVDSDDFNLLLWGYSQNFGIGTTQNNPFLPTSNVNGVMTFTNFPRAGWGDPPATSIVKYTMTGGALFDQIIGFPTGFSGPFEVILADGTSLGWFNPGDMITFPGNGVASFSIRGIDPGADLDSDTAFPLQISFNAETADFTLVTPPGWTVNTNGVWSGADNWSDGTPSGIGATANFLQAITAAHTVTLDGARTVGTINLDNNNSYTIAGSAITIDTTGADGAINVISGSHTISATMTLNKNTTITVAPAASTLTLGSDITATGIDITKAGDGVLRMKNIRAASLDISDGDVVVLSNGTASGTSRVASLSIASGSALDLANNNLIIEATDFADSVTKYAAAEALVISGFGNADWLGSGITSSSAAVFAQIDDSRVLGIINNSDWGHSSIEGFGVGPNDIIVKYTWLADANLDGLVDNDDFGQFLYGFNGGGSARWLNGDFDYDNDVDNDDFGKFLTGLTAFHASGNMQLSDEFKSELATFASANGIPLVLPEPGVLLPLGICALWCRRRRGASV